MWRIYTKMAVSSAGNTDSSFDSVCLTLTLSPWSYRKCTHMACTKFSKTSIFLDLRYTEGTKLYLNRYGKNLTQNSLITWKSAAPVQWYIYIIWVSYWCPLRNKHWSIQTPFVNMTNPSSSHLKPDLWAATLMLGWQAVIDRIRSIILCTYKRKKIISK